MLYHLSEENHNGEVFSPRVPYSTAYCFGNGECEDKTHKRVCFSTTISGAYRAIQFNCGEWLELYVHVPCKKNVKFYRPTEEQVFDCKFTNEVWVNRKVKMKCIGKIRAKYDYNMCSRQFRPNVKIKWIEKYTEIR